MFDRQLPDLDIDNKNWFAAQLKPNALSIAQRHLRRQGFRIFSPLRIETQSLGPKSVTRPRPLFPGYVFVQFDPTGLTWRKINSTRGVSRLIVNNSHRPTPLPSQFMGGLRARCDDDGLLKEPDELKPGDEIRVISGPFANVVTRIEKLTDDQRLQALISLMGQEIRISLAQTAVEKKDGLGASGTPSGMSSDGTHRKDGRR